MNQFKYVGNRLNSDNFAEMYLYDEIGYNPKTGKGVDGRQFAHELRYLAEYHEPELKEIKVRINSVGGSAMDGFSIFSAIYNANKTGKVKVNTYIDGVAASIAGVLAMAGNKIMMKDYGRLMLHGVSLLNPDGSEATNLTENDKNSILAFKDMIKQVFANNTTIPEAQIEELLTNGKDNWFTADEAAQAGFILKENIENTGLEIDLPVEYDATIIANRAKKIIENSINSKPLKMKTVINLLKLQEGASEEVVLAAVQNALKASSDSAEALLEATNKITEKDAKILELQGQVKASNEAAALAFVENAIKDGKFAPADDAGKTALVNQFVANPDGFKAMVNMMPTKAANIMNGVATGDAEGQAALIARINNRSLREIEKAEPALLSQLRNEAKPEFVKLWNAQYGTNKTEADFA